MENYKLVLPQHLNQFGYLYGGNLLKWVDESAWIAASLEYPGCSFVTVGMDKIEFKKSVKQGTILKFISKKTRQGNTSVEYSVEVYNENKSEENFVFSTKVTFVNVDKNGKKSPL
ncbi:MAG: acyl-CoA thioesterase [Elusimicrobiota bacterium]